MLIGVAPDKFPCLGPSELRRKKNGSFVEFVVWGKCGFLEKNVLFLWRCASILEFVIFFGGGGA